MASESSSFFFGWLSNHCCQVSAPSVFLAFWLWSHCCQTTSPLVVVPPGALAADAGALAADAGASQAADDADAPQATDERGALDAFGGAFKKASAFTTRLCVRSMGFLPRTLTNCSAQPRKTSRRRHSRCV